jgi:hypothetical protein
MNWGNRPETGVSLGRPRFTGIVLGGTRRGEAAHDDCDERKYFL